jgi:hypothetical protein
MALRILELNERARAEQPPRTTVDVATDGACFFHAARLGRQALGHVAPLTGDALYMQAWVDRCGMVVYTVCTECDWCALSVTVCHAMP